MQAKLLGERLREYGVKQIVSSPFKRTLITAETIASVLNVQFTIDPLYSEWLNESWHKQSPQIETNLEICKRYPHAIPISKIINIHDMFPESYEGMCRRCQKAVDIINSSKESVIIVTHGSIISQIASIMTKRVSEEFAAEVASLTILTQTMKDKWDVHINSNIDHLNKYLKVSYLLDKGR